MHKRLPWDKSVDVRVLAWRTHLYKISCGTNMLRHHLLVGYYKCFIIWIIPTALDLIRSVGILGVLENIKALKFCFHSYLFITAWPFLFFSHIIGKLAGTGRAAHTVWSKFTYKPSSSTGCSFVAEAAFHLWIHPPTPSYCCCTLLGRQARAWCCRGASHPGRCLNLTAEENTR